jgi:hypothetical protein
MSERSTTIDRSAGTRTVSRSQGLTLPMVWAEFTKVRTRIGLVAGTAILTVGAAVLVFGINASLHAGNPVKYGPAGGVQHLAAALGWVAVLSSFAAILVGATAGAADVQTGLFRDLVSTGRSRVALFAARVPGGLALIWPFTAAAWAVACAGSVLFAGDLATPTIADMIAGGAWVLLTTTCMYLLAVGLASATGSRTATVIPILLWQFFLSSVLVGMPGLGVLRQGIQMVALTRLIPGGLQSEPSDPLISSMSVGVAAAVLVAWAIVPLALGAWRTVTRDA